MIVAVDYNAALRQIAGIGRYAREVVRSYLGVDPDVQMVLFYAARDLDPRSPALAELDALRRQYANIRVVALPVSERALTIIWQRARLPLPLERWTGPVDIVHAPDFVLPPVRKAATVVTVHDLTFRVHPETAHPRLRRYLDHAVPRSLQRASAIVAVSQSTADDLTRLMGIDARKIDVIPHGISPHFRRVIDVHALEDVRQRYDLDQPFFLHVGTIEPRKNLVRLIEAFKALRLASEQRVELVLVGRTGWLAEPILAAARATAGVRLLGTVADRDLPAVYSLAAGVVYPSFYEGFGFPVLEALACGTPVIAANTSSLPEVAGKLGLLIDPHDSVELRHAMETVLTDPAMTRVAREQGPAYVAGYSWERAARQLHVVYQAVLQQKA